MHLLSATVGLTEPSRQKDMAWRGDACGSTPTERKHGHTRLAGGLAAALWAAASSGQKPRVGQMVNGTTAGGGLRLSRGGEPDVQVHPL